MDEEETEATHQNMGWETWRETISLFCCEKLGLEHIQVMYLLLGGQEHTPVEQGRTYISQFGCIHEDHPN